MTTDQAFKIAIDSDKAKELFPDTYIRKARSRLKKGGMSLDLKVKILTKIGFVPTIEWEQPTKKKIEKTITIDI